MARDPFEEADIESGGMPGELAGTFSPSFVRRVRQAAQQPKPTVDRMANDGTIHPTMFTQRSPEHQRALDELRREEYEHDRNMELRYKAQHREDEDYEGDWD